MEKVIKAKDVKVEDKMPDNIKLPVEPLGLSRRESMLSREDAFTINDLKTVLGHVKEITNIKGAKDAINRALNTEKTGGEILREVRKLDDGVKANIIHTIEELRGEKIVTEVTGKSELKLNNPKFFNEHIVSNVLGAAQYR